MPGRISGKVTFQNVRIGDAPEVLRGLLERPVEARGCGPAR